MSPSRTRTSREAPPTGDGKADTPDGGPDPPAAGRDREGRTPPGATAPHQQTGQTDTRNARNPAPAGKREKQKMKSDPENIHEMTRETTQRALHHAMAVEMAEQNEGHPDLWHTANDMAMGAKNAALMTVNSTMMRTCPEYREEQGRAGCIDIDEEDPRTVMHTHQCDRCSPLQEVAARANEAFGALWGTYIPSEKTPEATTLRRLHRLHSRMLGIVHTSVATALETGE